MDDFKNDDDVTVNVFRGRLDPNVGNKGLITPDQTFYLDYDYPISTAKNMQIIDGELIAGPVALQLPIDILDANFTLDMPGSQLRLTLNDDGSFQGILGGSFDVPGVLEELYNTGGAREVGLVAPVFETNADMNLEDGQCTRLSVAFGIEGAAAFVVRDSEKDPQ